MMATSSYRYHHGCFESVIIWILFEFIVYLPTLTHGARNLTDLRIAALLPDDPKRPFSLGLLMPAARMALEKVNQRLPVRLDLGHGNSQCSEAHGMNEAIKLYVAKQADVFLGPICDYAAAPVVRQASFWNVPVISTGSFAVEYYVNRRLGYPMLTRAGPGNLVSLADSFVQLMRWHGWRHMKVLYEREGQRS